MFIYCFYLRMQCPPFHWQCRPYFPPTLPLGCLGMVSPAPSLDATKHRAGATSRDTHPHKFWQKWCQADLRHVTIRLSGTSIATACPNRYPAPRLIDWASGQASPAQLCVIQSRPGWHKFTLHLHHQLYSSPQIPHHNLSHHFSLDGWGPGIDGKACCLCPCHGHLLGDPKESKRNGCTHLLASQLALLRVVASKNAVLCHRTLTHCDRDRPVWLIWSI